MLLRLLVSAFISLQLVIFSAKGIYHELSYKVLEPPEGISRSFGSSLGYFSNINDTNIVVGAPHADKVGQVYKCDTNDMFGVNLSTTCTKINFVETLAPSVRDADHDFCLGATISSINNMFLTCAPLWTSKKMYGKCFYYDTDSHLITEYMNLINQDKPQFVWNTFVDTANDKVIIMKYSLQNKFNDFKITYANHSSVRSGTHTFHMLKSFLNPSRTLGFSLAIGNFFSNTSENINIGISSNSGDMKGEVLFFEKDKNKFKLLENEIIKMDNDSYVLGSQFGYVMQANDFNTDGVSELIVTAPSYSNGHGYDCGALFIFIGGKTINADSRRRVIYSTIDGAMFGRSVATTDIDGDSIPEIIVSAPYENNNQGAVYILPGAEIKRILTETKLKIELKELKNVQELRRTDAHEFGFAIHVLPDIDNNGCNELVLGSPRAQKAFVYRCVPVMNVTIDIEGNETIADGDNSTLKLSIHISYPVKPDSVSTKIIIENKLKRNDLMLSDDSKELLKSNQSILILDLNSKNTKFVFDIDIIIPNSDPGHYIFTTKLKQDIDIYKISDFDPKWVNLSKHSDNKKEFEITYGCNKSEPCVPIFNLTVDWTIKNNNYILGQTKKEIVYLKIKNDGASARRACVKLKVQGARLKKPEIYPLPKFKMGQEYNISAELDISTNLDTTLSVIAELYEKCNRHVIEKRSLSAPITYNASKIHLHGSAHNVTVKYNNTKEVSFTTEHYYSVKNNNSFIYWKLEVEIQINDAPYLSNISIHGDFTNNCEKVVNQTNNFILYKCNLDLEPGKVVKFYATITVLKDKTKKILNNNVVKISSSCMLRLTPSYVIIVKKLVNHVIFQNKKLYQNKFFMTIIFSLFGLILLVIGIWVLYKCGFLKRKGKAKLIELKQEIRRQSVRRNTTVGQEGNEVFPDNISMASEVFDIDENQTNDDIYIAHSKSE